MSMPAPHRISRAHSRITGSIHGDADDSMAMISTVVAHGIVTATATMMVQIVRSMSGASYDEPSATIRLLQNDPARVSPTNPPKEKDVSDSMTATAVLDEPVPLTGAASTVNDCTIHVATVNGSGSQSSNSVLMRSIFQMGVPVSGKNMFPSNIAGLPTWFTIRANKDGWIARKKEVDIMICMNA